MTYLGLQAVPGICTKFVECYKGSSVIKDCPPGTHFCYKSLMCDWPSKAACDQVSTSTSVSMSSSVVSVSSSVSSSNQSLNPDQQSEDIEDSQDEIDWSGMLISKSVLIK